jgi:cell wall-associated NlpC family hydrolase
MAKKKQDQGKPVSRRAWLLGAAAVVLGAYGNRKTVASAAAAGKPASHPARRTASHQAHSHGAAKAAAAITFASGQLGKPYVWGGTGPNGWDCSGLTQAAYATAGVTIPRTSQEQWAAGPRVNDPQPGDLVFFPGSDGTWDAPGHVGLVRRAGHMIQAYAPGVGVVASTYGQPSSLAGTGPGTVIGYTRPWQ